MGFSDEHFEAVNRVNEDKPKDKNRPPSDSLIPNVPPKPSQGMKI